MPKLFGSGSSEWPLMQGRMRQITVDLSWSPAGWHANHSDGALVNVIQATNPSATMRYVKYFEKINGNQILFFDGHVRWVAASELVDVGMDHRGIPDVRVWSLLP